MDDIDDDASVFCNDKSLSDNSRTWICSICTFENQNAMHLFCVMCASPRTDIHPEEVLPSRRYSSNDVNIEETEDRLREGLKLATQRRSETIVRLMRERELITDQEEQLREYEMMKRKKDGASSASDASRNCSSRIGIHDNDGPNRQLKSNSYTYDSHQEVVNSSGHQCDKSSEQNDTPFQINRGISNNTEPIFVGASVQTSLTSKSASKVFKKAYTSTSEIQPPRVGSCYQERQRDSNKVARKISSHGVFNNMYTRGSSEARQRNEISSEYPHKRSEVIGDSHNMIMRISINQKNNDLLEPCGDISTPRARRKHAFPGNDDDVLHTKPAKGDESFDDVHDKSDNYEQLERNETSLDRLSSCQGGSKCNKATHENIKPAMNNQLQENVRAPTFLAKNFVQYGNNLSSAKFDFQDRIGVSNDQSRTDVSSLSHTWNTPKTPPLWPFRLKSRTKNDKPIPTEINVEEKATFYDSPKST